MVGMENHLLKTLPFPSAAINNTAVTKISLGLWNPSVEVRRSKMRKVTKIACTVSFDRGDGNDTHEETFRTKRVADYSCLVVVVVGPIVVLAGSVVDDGCASVELSRGCRWCLVFYLDRHGYTCLQDYTAGEWGGGGKTNIWKVRSSQKCYIFLMFCQKEGRGWGGRVKAVLYATVLLTSLPFPLQHQPTIQTDC